MTWRVLAVALLLPLLAACAGGDDGDDGGGTGTASPAPTAVGATQTGTPGLPDAFILYRDSVGDIIAENFATGEKFKHSIDPNEEVIVSAACSPDGSRIAFLKQTFDDFSHRRIIIRGEGAPVEPLLLSSLVQGFAWARGGSSLAIAEWDGIEQTARLSMLDIATGETTEIATGQDYIGGLTPSPDGESIGYYVQGIREPGSEIWAADVEAGETRPLTASSELQWLDPDWAPDGSRIVVAGTDLVTVQLYTLDPESGEPTQLTTSADIYRRGPKFSPDGSVIAYTGSIVQPQVSARPAVLHSFGIFLINPDGTGERALTADPRLNPGAQVDPYLDAFLLGWCRPGPWLDELWVEETS